MPIRIRSENEGQIKLNMCWPKTVKGIVTATVAATSDKDRIIFEGFAAFKKGNLVRMEKRNTSSVKTLPMNQFV